MKSKYQIWVLSAAIAGFLFGFDTVVISGANLPIKELWNTSPIFHGTFIMSMALWGTVIGAIFGGIPTERFGRKKTLFWIGILFSLSAIGSAFAPDPYSFSFFRFIGGLAVGASSVAVPTYLSEIASTHRRGRIVALYQFMIVFGILVAFISNFLLQGVGGTMDWRFMLGIEALPAIAYSILVLFIPNSPRWLVLSLKDEEKASSILKELGVEDIQSTIHSIKQSSGAKGQIRFWSKTYSWPITLAFLIAFFNQLSGINFVLYYAPEILESSGLASRDSLFSSISIGIVNLLFTILGMYLIDKAGRKKLLVIGSAGYIISLFMVGMAFNTQADPVFLLSFILLFVASHAIGQGAVIWVFIAEIFPNRVRAFGQSFGSATHWILAAIITLITPLFLDQEKGIYGENPAPIFFFFAAFMVLQLLFVLFLMPETKGKSLENLETDLL